MSSNKGGFMDFLFDSIMPKVYGIGAAVVIVGAMFKINHWPGATLMLVAGLSTEAVIFFLSAFQPQHKDPDWAKVYPELAEDYEGEPVKKPVKAGNKESVTRKLDSMMENAKIEPKLIESLGKGLHTMAESTKKMATIGDASVATTEYANNVKAAAKSMSDMNKSYSSTTQALGQMASASNDVKAYHDQVKNVTKQLGALNAVYEMELKDANNHMKALNKFYANVTPAMESMAAAGKETELFKNQLSSLTSNITTLNTIYGNMLSAMKGGATSAK